MFDGFTEVVAPPPLLPALAPNAVRRRPRACPPGGRLADLLDEGYVLAEYPSAREAWTPEGEKRSTAAESAMIDRTAGWDQITAWSEATKMQEISAAVDRAVERAECRPDGEKLWTIDRAVDSLVHDFALAWRVAGRTAQHRVDEAVNLVQGCPLVISAMIRGDITLAHGRSLAEVLLRLGRELADRVADEVLDDDARLSTPARLAARARRVALRLDPDAAVRRERAARQERGVDLKADDDGMATITVYLPAAEAVALYRTVDAHARRVSATDVDGERRSMDARRADSLRDLVAAGALLAAGAECSADDADTDTDTATDPPPCRCSDHESRDADDEHAPAASDPDDGDQPAEPEPERLSGPAPGPGPRTTSDQPHDADARPRPERSGRPAPQSAPTSMAKIEVRVVVGADTLLGLDDRPAELVGYGPITAAEARRLAADHDATWRRILTDPVSGTVLDVGHTRYRPPPSMAEHVRSRDVTCYFPGCRMPATACDLDHVVPFDPESGTGPTSAANLRPACRRHHQIKQLPGWSVRCVGDHEIEWTTPTGRRYRTVRSPLLPATVIPDRPRPPAARVDDDAPTPDPVPF